MAATKSFFLLETPKVITMSTAVLAITYQLSAPTFAAGTVIDHLAVSITGSVTPVVSQSVSPLAPTATFANVVPDTYTASVQAMDASGNALGAPATTTFVVSAPATISLNLPSAVAVTVS
jgi:hypothetical protein